MHIDSTNNSFQFVDISIHFQLVGVSFSYAVSDAEHFQLVEPARAPNWIGSENTYSVVLARCAYRFDQ